MKYCIVFIMFSLSLATTAWGQDTLTIRQIQEVPPGGDISPFMTGNLCIPGEWLRQARVHSMKESALASICPIPAAASFLGLKAYSPTIIGFPTLTPGDSVICQGTVTDDGMTTFIITLQDVSIRRHGPPIEPLTILAREIDPYTGGDSLAEKYEAVFVRINDITVDSTIEYWNSATWYCHDYGGSFIV